MVAHEARSDDGWRERPVPPIARSPRTISISCWERRGMTVISELCFASSPDGIGTCLQWKVSVRGSQGRPTKKELKTARRDFKLDGWEEDNHLPGDARHFWLVVDPYRRAPCVCKDDEVLVTDPDGYQWTTPRGGPCRGCAVERVTGRPCTLHSDNRSYADQE